MSFSIVMRRSGIRRKSSELTIGKMSPCWRFPPGNRHALELDNASQIEEGMSIAVTGYPLATLEFSRIGGCMAPLIDHGGIVSAIRYEGRVIQVRCRDLSW